MSDLKTLKDIHNWHMSEEDVYDFGKGKFFDMFVQTKQLRAEAIKWVKEMDITRDEEYCNGQMDFILTFFNLTEEDLKEQKFNYADVIVE